MCQLVIVGGVRGIITPAGLIKSRQNINCTFCVCRGHDLPPYTFDLFTGGRLLAGWCAALDIEKGSFDTV